MASGLDCGLHYAQHLVQTPQLAQPAEPFHHTSHSSYTSMKKTISGGTRQAKRSLDSAVSSLLALFSREYAQLVQRTTGLYTCTYAVHTLSDLFRISDIFIKSFFIPFQVAHSIIGKKQSTYLGTEWRKENNNPTHTYIYMYTNVEVHVYNTIVECYALWASGSEPTAHTQINIIACLTVEVHVYLYLSIQSCLKSSISNNHHHSQTVIPPSYVLCNRMKHSHKLDRI